MPLAVVGVRPDSGDLAALTPARNGPFASFHSEDRRKPPCAMVKSR